MVGLLLQLAVQAKRFISKLSIADLIGVDTPGPRAYGETVLVERGGLLL